MATMLERMQRMVRGETPAPPIGRLLGFELVGVEPGRATFRMDAGPQHANPMGTLHGGVLCDIADAAMGIAFASTLGEGETFTTLELKINFLKPVWSARLTAVGKVVKRGRTVGLAQCDVTDADGHLVAHATSTCMALAGKMAREGSAA